MQPPPEQFRFTFLSFFVLVVFGLIWPAISFYFMDSQIQMAQLVTDPALEIYLPTIVFQLFALLLVLAAVLLERTDLRDVGMRGFNRWTVLIAGGFFLVANLALLALQTLIAGGAPGSFADFAELLPQTPFERSVWILLTAIVAVSEEIIFRGYLITRLGRLFKGRIWIAAIISSLSFASGHLYQGKGGLVLIFIYGMMFAALYVKTGSLYPGIIAHFIQDAIVAVFPNLAS